MTAARRFYVVSGRASHGSITHKCPTAAMALETLHRFTQDAVQGITIFDPDGLPLSQEALTSLSAGAAPAPVALERFV